MKFFCLTSAEKGLVAPLSASYIDKQNWCQPLLHWKSFQSSLWRFPRLDVLFFSPFWYRAVSRSAALDDDVVCFFLATHNIPRRNSLGWPCFSQAVATEAWNEVGALPCDSEIVSKENYFSFFSSIKCSESHFIPPSHYLLQSLILRSIQRCLTQPDLYQPLWSRFR